MHDRKLLINLLLPLAFIVAVANAEQAQTTGPENGTLLIAGGGSGHPKHLKTILDRFIELAGGKEARIIVIPTAASSSPDYAYQKYGMARRLRQQYKVKSVGIVHTHDPKVADTKDFIQPINEATGIWFSGGRQWRFTKAYRGTLAEKAFRKVLARGGVIAGSSSGATIQGSFLARGDSKTNTIMVGDFQYGFGYIKNVAIDQHIVPRKRQLDMVEVLEDPGKKMNAEFDRSSLLGLGIDEDTAIVVKGNHFQVIGKPTGLVFIYDPRKWTANTPPHEKYITLKHLQFYDLESRTPFIPNSD